jgi:DNA-binding CsgD family transcriptional regulator
MLHSLYRYSRNAITNKEKSQAKVMMNAILISCSTGFIFLMLMPLFDAFRIPLLTPYFFAVYLYGVFFAMVKYRFMSFNIKDISREILTQIQETVLILNTELIVIESNSNPNELQPIDTSQFAGMKFKDITLPDELISSMFDRLAEGEISSFRERIIYRGTPENIMTDSSVSAVYDRFGDFSAILVVSRECRGISRFRKYYKLTEREMEIILLTISGLSNIEISKRLSITKRTVETHQNNIYNKMGISNKIELLNVTSDFDIKAV